MDAPSPARLRGRLSRGAYRCLGLTFVALGMVGVVIPVWPTTIWFILALWAFKKSSSRLEAWLLNHPVFGPTLRDWEESGSIRRRTKVVAITMIWVCLAITAVLVQRPVVVLILGITGALLTAYLVTRPTKPE